jgi:hypothetical protein
MSSSVLLVGATGNIGNFIAAGLSQNKHLFSRTAFLTASADSGVGKEAKYAAVGLERVVGSWSSPGSYSGLWCAQIWHRVSCSRLKGLISSYLR